MTKQEKKAREKQEKRKGVYFKDLHICKPQSRLFTMKIVQLVYYNGLEGFTFWKRILNIVKNSNPPPYFSTLVFSNLTQLETPYFNGI